MARINEWRSVDSFFVHAFTIAGTDCVVVEVWERADDHQHGHGTITFTSHPDGMKLGKVGSRRWISDLPALSEERSEAFNAHKRELVALCHDAIDRSEIVRDLRLVNIRDRDADVEAWLAA